MLDGRDVSQIPLELTNGGTSPNLVLTYSDRRTLLSGVVHLGTDVAPISTGSRLGFLPTIGRGFSRGCHRTCHHGRRALRMSPLTAPFSFAGLAPGEYLVAALRAEDCAPARSGVRRPRGAGSVAACPSETGSELSVELDIVKSR